MSRPLPDSWDDEPWPLEDPIPAPGLRPTNWSDTHETVPQVADLADEAWQYAMDHGISMERALAELQRREHYRAEIDRQVWGSSYVTVNPNGYATGGLVNPLTVVPVTRDTIADAKAMQQAMDRAWERLRQTLTADPSSIVVQMRGMSDKATGDRVLAEAKAVPIVPSWQWDACVEDDR